MPEHQVLEVHPGDLHFRELRLDELEFADRPAELHAGTGILGAEFEALRDDPERHRRDARALHRKGRLGAGAPAPASRLLALAEQPLALDEHVLEEELPGGRGVHAHLAQRLGLHESRHAAIEDEVQHLALARLVALVELADEDDRVGVRTVGDEGLAAVEHVAVPAALRGGHHAAEGV